MQKTKSNAVNEITDTACVFLLHRKKIQIRTKETKGNGREKIKRKE
jgi:hypothetical protein